MVSATPLPNIERVRSSADASTSINMNFMSDFMPSLEALSRLIMSPMTDPRPPDPVSMELSWLKLPPRLRMPRSTSPMDASA
jgi:hypothetical protein